MMRNVIAVAVLLLAVGYAAVRWTGQSTSQPGTSEQRPLRLAVTDIEGMEALQREFGAFRDRLAKQSGVPLEFFPISDRTAAVEALKNDQIDLVMTGPAEYVMFRSKADVEPVVGFSRPNYFATISVRHDSGIKKLEGLRGKRIAMGDIGSTSKHLGPLDLLIKAGVTRDDVTIIHTSIQGGWEALLAGDVAAFATTSDKIDLLRGNTQDHNTVIIAESPQLPMDVLLAAKHVTPELRDKLRKAFEADSEALVSSILKGNDNQKYVGMSFAPNIQDADYDLVREMFVAAGLDHMSTNKQQQAAKK